MRSFGEIMVGHFLIRHDRSLSYSSSTQYYTYQLQSQFSFDKAITRPSYVRQHFKNSVSLCYFADMVSSNGTSAAVKNYICNLSCQWPRVLAHHNFIFDDVKRQTLHPAHMNLQTLNYFRSFHICRSWSPSIDVLRDIGIGQVDIQKDCVTSRLDAHPEEYKGWPDDLYLCLQDHSPLLFQLQ